MRKKKSGFWRTTKNKTEKMKTKKEKKNVSAPISAARYERRENRSGRWPHERKATTGETPGRSETVLEMESFPPLSKVPLEMSQLQRAEVRQRGIMCSPDMCFFLWLSFYLLFELQAGAPLHWMRRFHRLRCVHMFCQHRRQQLA